MVWVDELRSSKRNNFMENDFPLRWGHVYAVRFYRHHERRGMLLRVPLNDYESSFSNWYIGVLDHCEVVSIVHACVSCYRPDVSLKIQFHAPYRMRPSPIL